MAIEKNLGNNFVQKGKEMKNKFYIMVGCPGSGKSTYAKKNFPNALYVSRDEIRFSLVKENEEYFSKENEVFTDFINTINLGLAAGDDVIADATHLNSKSRMKLLGSVDLDKTKTEVIAIVMQTPLELCIKRNELRKGTRSYVPINVIKNMYKFFKIPTFEECYGMIDNIILIKPKVY